MFNDRRKIAKLLILIFAFSLIYSFTILAIHSFHECVGEECEICFTINTVKNFLGSIIAVAALGRVIRVFCIGSERLKESDRIFKLTPVLLKVKLLE